MPFERNTKAEDYSSVLVPKDSLYVVGIETVDAFINTNTKGDHKGRRHDKYKIKVRVLEPGDHFNQTVRMSFSAMIERIEGSTGIETVPYGGSKRYCEIVQAINPSVEDAAVPSPNSDDDIESFAERTFVGKMFTCKFGTYSWETTDKSTGLKVNPVINTIKEAMPVGDDMLDALKAHIATWTAETMADHLPGGTEFNENMFADD